MEFPGGEGMSGIVFIVRGKTLNYLGEFVRVSFLNVKMAQ